MSEARRFYRPWTDAEVEYLRAQRAKQVPIWEIANALNRPRKAVEKKAERCGASLPGARRIGPPPPPPPDTATLTGDAETRTVEGAALGRIQTLDELLDAARVDRTQWEVERFVVNKWEVGAKAPDGSICVAPLWQVKAWLRALEGAALARHTERLMAHISADTAQRQLALPLKPRDRFAGEPHLLEVTLFDLHLGKLAWAPETGADYDAKIADARAREALEDLLWQASIYPVTRICLPLGNDFFHVDTITGLTTAGTPQDRDTRWHHMFEWGRGLASWMLHRCAEVAPVIAPVVPGNHDTQTDYAMGAVLAAEFASDPRVTIDNAPTRRKYLRFGANLLGYTHGNAEKIADLPGIMATERPQDWGETKFREWHIGHRHRPKQMVTTPVDGKQGVRVREITSLAGDDAWHVTSGYVGEPKGAEAFVWRFTGGVRAHCTHFTEASRATMEAMAAMAAPTLRAA